MIATTLAIFIAATPAPSVCGVVAPPVVATDTLVALFRSGSTFDAFLESARRRRDSWIENTERADLSDDIVARARATGGPWRILAVAEDGCSDSVNTIPYIAGLAEAADNLELRIIDSRVGRFIMEQRRTPDDRAATPTIVVLDAHGNEVGCWIERPERLQRWILDNPESLSRDELFERKMAWYRDDAGTETVREIVALLERAARGAGAACAP